MSYCCFVMIVFYCCFVIIFCCFVDCFILLSLLSFCIFLQNLCSSELIKDGNKERLRQLVPPTHRRVYLALQNRQLMQNMAAGSPPWSFWQTLPCPLTQSMSSFVSETFCQNRILTNSLPPKEPSREHNYQTQWLIFVLRG